MKNHVIYRTRDAKIVRKLMKNLGRLGYDEPWYGSLRPNYSLKRAYVSLRRLQQMWPPHIAWHVFNKETIIGYRWARLRRLFYCVRTLLSRRYIQPRFMSRVHGAMHTVDDLAYVEGMERSLVVAFVYGTDERKHGIVEAFRELTGVDVCWK